MIKNLFRISSTPGKTLLWLLLKKDLTSVKGDLGVDLAGGSMLNKCFFKTKRYVSVDINQIKLSEGMEVYPDAIAVNETIQNYLSGTTEKPNLLVCVQTFGTNMFFEHQETVEVIKNMSKTLGFDGSMTFNVGSFGDVDLEELKNKLSPFLKAQFQNVNFRFYGAMHKRVKLPRWKFTEDGIIRVENKTLNKIGVLKKAKHLVRSIFILGLAYTMYLLPPLRTAFGKKKLYLYCFCSGKLQER
tara:strand:+ start:182 stop:910 length:729 start_codon:yes stop_codon:yes gene_type:complete